MDCFKLRPGANRIFSITQSEYLLQTQKKGPYCIQDSKGVQHYYAVCPECDNPIQIVGLYRGTVEAGGRPYGRHHKGDIPGLCTYHEKDYYDCIYADPNWKRPNGKRGSTSRLSKEILRLLRDQFDRIIYILSKDTNIQIGAALARKMLYSFLGDEAWRYRMTTLNNLPWVLGEASLSTPIFGQRIVRGSELHEAIVKHCPAARCMDMPGGHHVKIVSQPNEYLDLNFFFLNHKKQWVEANDTVEESIDFEADSKKKIIYHKTIQIRPEYFLNLIHLPEERSHRNETLLKIAFDLISPELLM